MNTTAEMPNRENAEEKYLPVLTEMKNGKDWEVFFLRILAKAVIGTKENETIEFPSVRQAGEFIGRDHKGIVRAIKGDGQTTCAGYTWRYK